MSTSELVDYNTSDISLNPLEEKVFLNENNQCRVCRDANNKPIVLFPTDNVRMRFVQMFLSHYARHIESKSTKEGCIVLEFMNDRHILATTIHPRVYSMCVRVIPDREKFKEEYPEFEKAKFTLVDNMINLLVFVKSIGYVGTYHINPFQLFSKVISPQELYDGRIVHLTMLQREIFLAPETKTTFYQHEGALEPFLMEDNLRELLVKQSIYNLIKDDKTEKTKYHVIHLRDADRGLVDMANEIPLNYENYYETSDIENFKEDEFYEDMKNYELGEDEAFYVIYYYKPFTDETILVSWAPINEKELLIHGNKYMKKQNKITIS